MRQPGNSWLWSSTRALLVVYGAAIGTSRLAEPLTFSASTVSAATAPCLPRTTPRGSVCVCNSTYCDSYEVDAWSKLDPGVAYVTSTSMAGERMKLTTHRPTDQATAPSTTSTSVVITLDRGSKLQTMKG